MYIKPAAGLRIVDPDRVGTPEDFLPAAGREVTPSDYWTRRLRDGDVLAATAPTTSQAAQASPAP